MIEQLGGLNISDDFKRGAIDELRESQQELRNELLPQLENAGKALRGAKKERDKVYHVLISDKLDNRNSAFINQRLLELNKEVEDLEARIAYLKAQRDRASKDPRPRLESEFRKLRRLSELFTLDSPDKSGIQLSIKAYVKQIEISADKEYTILLNDNLLSSTSKQKNGSPIRIALDAARARCASNHKTVLPPEFPGGGMVFAHSGILNGG